MNKYNLISGNEDDFDIEDIRESIEYLNEIANNIYWFDFYKRKIRVRLIAS